MATDQRLEILGLQPTCNGGAPSVPHATIVDAEDITIEETLRGVERLTFRCPLISRSASALIPGTIVRVQTDDPDVFSELRVADLTRATADSPTLTCTGRSLWYDLADLGRIRTLSLGNRAQWAFSVTDVTVADLWATIIAPFLAASGRGWIALGTNDFPTERFSLSWTGLTVAALLEQVAKLPLLQAELTFRANGRTSYLIDVLKQVGAGAPVPDLRDGTSLLSLVYTSSRVEQCNVAEPIVAGDASLEDHWWRVQSVDVGAETIILEDPDGGPGPLTEDDQVNGWFLFRASVRGQSSEWLEVADSVALTHTLILTGRASTVQPGQLVQFRRSVGTKERLDAHRLESLRPLRITGVTPGTRTIACEHPWANSVVAVPADDELLGWTGRILRFVSASPLASFDPVTRRIGVASTTGWSAGQYLLCLNAAASPGAAQPWTLYPSASRVMRIVSVVSPTIVEVENPYSDAAPFTVSGTTGTGFAWVLSAIATPAIEDTVSGTASYVMASVTGVLAGDFVLPSQTFDGITVQELPAPHLVQTHARSAKTVTRTDQHADWMVTPNAALRSWSAGATSAPDGYLVNAAVKRARLRESLERVIGPYSLALRHRSSGFFASGGGIGAVSGTLIGPDDFQIGDVVDIGASGTLETRTLTDVSPDGKTLTWVGGLVHDHTVALQNGVVEQGAGGTPTLEIPALWAPSVIGADRYTCLVHAKLQGAASGAVVTVRFRSDDWDSSNQELTDVTSTGLTGGTWRKVGLALQVAPGARMRAFIELNAKVHWPPGAVCYVDLVGLVRTNASALPALVEYAGGTKAWQLAALQLKRAGRPPTTIEVNAREFVTSPGRPVVAPTLGGVVRVMSPWLPEVVSPRLIGRRRVMGDPSRTTYTLDTARLDLPSVLRQLG